MKLLCRIFGHKLSLMPYEKRPCKRVGCDHMEPAWKRPPIPPMPKKPKIENLKITDKDRINFIESLNGSTIQIQRNTLIGSQPNQEGKPIQIFTIKAQHQYGKNAREVIDIAMKFELGERYWEKENWEEKYPKPPDLPPKRKICEDVFSKDHYQRNKQ